jgi:hypothetical protein
MKTKPVFGFRYSLAARSLVIAALICCSSTASAQDRGDEEEGVVFGTVVIGVAEPAANSSLMRGRKLDETKWGLQIVKDKSFFCRKQVAVRSGSEEHFLLELGAGSYTFDQLMSGFANFYFPVGVIRRDAGTLPTSASWRSCRMHMTAPITASWTAKPKP